MTCMPDGDPPGEAVVLVAVITRPADLARARDAGWYRIPAAHAPAPLAVDYLALYQTAAFGAERWAVRWYAPVVSYRLLPRRELLPEEPGHPRAGAPYWRLDLGQLRALPLPVPARRLRRVTFIVTTFRALRLAHDITDLWALRQGEPGPVWGSGLAGRRIPR